MDEQGKHQTQCFAERFWTYEPQPCFPQMIEELGDGIRKFPNRDKFNDRYKVICEKCGHVVGETTPNMGKFGGGQFIPQQHQQK